MQVLLISGWDDWIIWSWEYVNEICNANCIGADIMDEHCRIIMVNSRTCNANNEIWYRYYYVIHVTYAYLYKTMNRYICRDDDDDVWSTFIWMFYVMMDI
jgi:hypothetical protein